MVEVISEQLRHHSEVRGCGLRNKNTGERDIVFSGGLMIGVGIRSVS